VWLGVSTDDQAAEADWMVDKLLGLRIFENAAGRFDASVTDIAGSVLVVSQFTLYADTHKGRRPSFSAAATGAAAEPLYRRVIDGIAARAVPVQAGRFGARMRVRLVNDGPVTIVLDSQR
jgi:D-aminoacyl-tRNA deacylase